MQTTRVSHLVLGCVVGLACVAGDNAACFAQLPVVVKIEAASGEPFGVGKMTVDFPPNLAPQLAADQPLWLGDDGGRVLYPAFKIERTHVPASRNDDRIDSAAAYFLFRGTDPFDLSFFDINGSHRTRVEPKDDQPARKRLLDDWWRLYSATAMRLAQADTYPLDIENYLVAMLARRLELPPPVIRRQWSGRDDVDSIFGTLLGAESVRLAMQKETLLQKADATEEANQPLPVPTAMQQIAIPSMPADIELEPIARHVPAECFYVRCGSLANLQWLRATIDDWGGDLRNLVAVRGLDYNVRGTLERQLALRETALGALLGDAVMADVALIGTDTFFREGAAFGVLFQARNNAVLAAEIAAQRKATLDAEETASEAIVEIAGHRVSCLSTADNSIRSFYATDGNYHLVTTSKTIMRRFFEAGAGKDALYALPEFRYARALMPVGRKDTVFVYLSDPFFRMLVSPHYRVEMTRRMQAQAEIGLVALARLAAKAEQQPAERLEQLIARGFLPKGFGSRPDGSRTVLKDGRIVDSLRGARNTFLPVPDVEIAGLTTREVNSYNTFAQMYAAEWKRVDPVIVGVRRELKPGAQRDRDREQVVLDVHITPYAQQHYSMFAGFLNRPDEQRILPIPGNVIEGEVRLAPGVANSRDASYRLFGGLRDFVPEFAIHDGEVIVSTGIDRGDVPVYFGESSPGMLRGLLNGGATRDPAAGSEENAIEEAPDKVWFRWRQKLNQFLVFSDQKPVLDAVVPQLKLEAAERPAQLRLRVRDLAETRWSRLLQAYAYVRARTTSAGGVRFMHALVQQLRVDAEECPATAQAVLGAKLVCPLGGEYKANLFGPGPVHWKSTAWADKSQSTETRVPEGWRAPLLEWFRGLKLEFSIDRTTLSTRIELELQPKPVGE